MKNLIFIPARSGSRRVKNKNLKILKNKPLIYYTLEIAKEIKKKIKSTDIIVSSDSKKIINYSNKILKTHNNYKRPKKLSSDKSSTVSALVHLLDYLKLKKKYPEIIITLQPTSPIRNIQYIHRALNILKKNKNIQSLVSVSRPMEAIKDVIVKKKDYKFLSKSKISIKHYVINGNFYVNRTKNIINKKKFFDFSKQTQFYEIKKNYAIDIDEKLDFKLCENFIWNLI